MLIPLALTVACTVMMYHGWEKGVAPWPISFMCCCFTPFRAMRRF